MFKAIPYTHLRLFLDGMLCMMALYALVSFTQHRKSIYWQYAFYILCLVLTFYWDDLDYGHEGYLPGANCKVAVIESLAFILYIRFAILLIDIPKLDPFSFKILKVMIAILVIEILVDITFEISNTAAEIRSDTYIGFRSIISVAALIVVPRILKLRQAAVGYFIAGSLFFVMGCLTALIVNFFPDYFNLNPANAFTFPVTYMQTGVVLEVLCFTMGMSVLNRKNEIEKIEVQKQLIEQLLENEKKQSALIRIRDDISRDVHDELGADLSSISAMSYGAIKQLKTGDPNTEQTLFTIGETARKVIARMREIIWSLHSIHDSVDNFMFRAKETAYTLFEHHPIAIQVELPQEEVDSRIPSEYRRNLFLVYKEILHNILRHSKAQNVHIKISVTGRFINLEVSDDGIGFDYDINNQMGNGLHNLRERTDSFSGELKIESQRGKGTIVLVLCPIDQNTQYIKNAS